MVSLSSQNAFQNDILFIHVKGKQSWINVFQFTSQVTGDIWQKKPQKQIFFFNNWDVATHTHNVDKFTQRPERIIKQSFLQCSHRSIKWFNWHTKTIKIHAWSFHMVNNVCDLPCHAVMRYDYMKIQPKILNLFLWHKHIHIHLNDDIRSIFMPRLNKSYLKMPKTMWQNLLDEDSNIIINVWINYEWKSLPVRTLRSQIMTCPTEKRRKTTTTTKKKCPKYSSRRETKKAVKRMG